MNQNLLRYVSPGGRNVTPEKRLVRKNSLARKAFLGPHFKLVVGARKIGEGQYGVVYGGYRKYNKSGIVRKVTKYKNKLDINALVNECKLHQKIYKYVPTHVSKVFRCGQNGSMNMERLQGGDLNTFFKANITLLNDFYMRIIILQVLSTLKKIHSADPSFRHNDLHMGNILVDNSPAANKSERINNFTIPPIGVRIVITDFGMSTDSVTKNPYHTASYKKNYGIYNGSDYMYDTVLFLNEMYSFTKKLPSKFPLTNMFLKDVLSGGYNVYNKSNNKHVYADAHGRMKANHIYKFDFADLFAHPYFVVALSRAGIYMSRNSRNSKWKSMNITPSVVKKWGGVYVALKKSPKKLTHIVNYKYDNMPKLSIKSISSKSSEKSFKYNPLRTPINRSPSPLKKRKTPTPPRVSLSPISRRATPVSISPLKKRKTPTPPRVSLSPISSRATPVSISPLKKPVSFMRVNQTPTDVHKHLNNYAAKLNVTKSKPKHILQYFRNSGASTPQARQATKALVERFVSPSSERDEAWIKARNALAGSGITIHKF